MLLSLSVCLLCASLFGAAVTTLAACNGTFDGGDRLWVSVSSYNYDNVLSSLQTLFEVSTTEGWADAMWAAVDGTSVRQRLLPLLFLCLSFSISYNRFSCLLSWLVLIYVWILRCVDVP